MRKLVRKKTKPLVELAVKVPFEAARKQEAIDATSASFWRIARSRIAQPEFQEAIKQFNREFLQAQAKARL